MQLTVDLVDGGRTGVPVRSGTNFMRFLQSSQSPLRLRPLWYADESPPILLSSEGGETIRFEWPGQEPCAQGDRLELHAYGDRAPGLEPEGYAHLRLGDAWFCRLLLEEAPPVIKRTLHAAVDPNLQEWPDRLDAREYFDQRKGWRRTRAAMEAELLRYEQRVMGGLRSLDRLERLLGVEVALAAGDPRGPDSPDRDPYAEPAPLRPRSGQSPWRNLTSDARLLSLFGDIEEFFGPQGALTRVEDARVSLAPTASVAVRRGDR